MIELFDVMATCLELAGDAPQLSGRLLGYAKATGVAPLAMASTIVAAPTMVAPGTVCSSVSPCGLVQAPHSHTFPPFCVQAPLKTASPHAV